MEPDESNESVTSSERDALLEYAGRVTWMATQALHLQGYEPGTIIAGLAFYGVNSGLTSEQWGEITDRSRAYALRMDESFDKENQ